MTNHARNGAARERQVRDHLIARNWTFIMRSAGSKGPADIAMAHPEYGLALFQVGATSKTLGPADRTRLLNAAELCSALPIVAICWHGISYRIINQGPPSGWAAWTP